MNKRIFEDISNDESLLEARKKLFDPVKANSNLRNRVGDSVVGFEELMDAVRKAFKAVEKTDAKVQIEVTKKEFDKIAFLIEEFSSEFAELYEKMLALYTAERLSGSFDKKDNGNIVTINSIDIDTIGIINGEKAIAKLDIGKELGWKDKSF